MLQFILRRLLLSIPVLIGVLFLVVALPRLLPGEPCTAMLGERATPAICAEFTKRFGLDQSIPVQFVSYIGQLLQGNLGESIRYGRPVSDILLERLPVTVELTFWALLFAVVVGMLLGIASAAWRNSPADVGTMVVANLGVSTPVFVLGLLFQFTFAVALRGTPFSLPPSGRLTAGTQVMPLDQAWGLGDVGGPLGAVLQFLGNIYTLNGLLTFNWSLIGDAMVHLVLPAVALGTIPMAIIARMTRSSLLEVLGQDYVRTARAKGLTERLVLFRHALRNAMLPVITVIGLSLGALLSGAILTETIFNLTGLGKTLVDSILSRDYIVIQGVTLFVAFIYVMVNLVVDISYGYLDPRIRLR
jgi:peptide/nickel transport system permease protein